MDEDDEYQYIENPYIDIDEEGVYDWNKDGEDHHMKPLFDMAPLYLPKGWYDEFNHYLMKHKDGVTFFTGYCYHTKNGKLSYSVTDGVKVDDLYIGLDNFTFNDRSEEHDNGTEWYEE